MRTAIVILNWNGWKDTVECLESVFRLDFSCFRVIVCDNASNDGSLEKVKSWADGRLDVAASGVRLKAASNRLSKPIRWVEYNREQAETGGFVDEDAPLVLIQTGANLGFAGGNNVGLRYVVSRGDCDYVWILNNDTVVEPDALTHLVASMKNKPGSGMCGSKLVFYHQPSKVQAYGGAAFDARRGVVTPLGQFQSTDAACDTASIERQTAYVVGASMLVSRPFLEDVGLMSEDYFLYFEEIDWAFRAYGKFNLAYSNDSVVYHKEGGSIGSSSTSEPSVISTRYLYRNRVLFNWKFNRTNFVRVLFRIGFELLVLLKRKQYKTAKIALRSTLSGLLNLNHLGSGYAK